MMDDGNNAYEITIDFFILVQHFHIFNLLFGFILDYSSSYHVTNAILGIFAHVFYIQLAPSNKDAR